MTHLRHVPKQQRSRDRVEKILEATAEIVAWKGVSELSLRTVAIRSGVPETSVYRYFADKYDLAAAFMESEMAKINREVYERFAGLDRVSIRSIVDVPIRAHYLHHKAHPENVAFWFQGPASDVLRDRVREQDRLLGEWIRDVTVRFEMLDPPISESLATMNVRLSDRVLEYVLTSGLSDKAQVELIDSYVEMRGDFMERNATTVGLRGVPVAEFLRQTPDPGAGVAERMGE